VIPKEIRDRLGVKPGWQALQLVVGDHLEVYFVPPPHNRSLAGCLAPYLKRRPVEGDEEEWDAAIGRAIAQEFAEESREAEESE
jgi:bifunctional DNA-binding transcriptional regulator/antitoxin component of YhaV-PrlF toxin-antitoxin module